MAIIIYLILTHICSWDQFPGGSPSVFVGQVGVIALDNLLELSATINSKAFQQDSSYMQPKLMFSYKFLKFSPCSNILASSQLLFFVTHFLR